MDVVVERFALLLCVPNDFVLFSTSEDVWVALAGRMIAQCLEAGHSRFLPCFQISTYHLLVPCYLYSCTQHLKQDKSVSTR
jgi:hypothetical protein